MPDPYTTSITVPTLSYDLTVLATVKRELGITDSESDALLADYISEQSNVVASYCGRKFAQETIVDSFKVDYGTCLPLILSRPPVVSVLSVVGAGTTIDPTGYEVDPTSGRIWRLEAGLYSWWSASKIVVTYVGGYELLTTLPRDVERATVVLVKQAWFDRARDPRAKSESVDGVGSKSYWGEQVEYAGAMPAEVVGLLRPYRNCYV